MSDINIPIEAGKSILLETAGKICDKNIVVTVSGGAGNPALIVTVDEETGMASHTSQEIYDHVQNGGNVVLLYGEHYYQLSATADYTSEFSILADDYTGICFYIANDGTYYMQEINVGDREWVANLETRIEALEQKLNSSIAENMMF
jgi:hypothetical protein